MTAHPAQQPAPDGGVDSRRGWRVLVGCGIVAAFGVQVLWGGTIGLFLRPMQQELGWSRADIGFVTVLTAAAAFIVVPAAGWLIDRLPLRPLIFGGCVVQGLCVAAGALLGGSIWNFYAQVFAIMVLGMAASLMTLSKVARGWFERSLGRAMGLLFAIASVGGVLNPLLAQALMDRLGWRSAYLVMGLGSIAITAGVSLLLIRERPGAQTHAKPATAQAAAAPTVPLRELFGRRAWWVLTAWSVLFGYAVSGLGFHLAALLQDRGATPAQSALALSMGAASGLLGNLAAGWVTDRFSVRLMASVVMLLPTCGVLLLLGSDAVAVGLAASIVLGLSTGTEHSVVAILCSRYFALRLYGRAYASQLVAASAGSALAPSIVGLMQARTGSYALPLAVAAVAFGTGAVLAWLLPRLGAAAQEPATDAPGLPA